MDVQKVDSGEYDGRLGLLFCLFLCCVGCDTLPVCSYDRIGIHPDCCVIRLMKAAGQAKAPLVHSEALSWLQSCVNDFGAGLLPAAQVVAFAVSELEHVNPKVCA